MSPKSRGRKTKQKPNQRRRSSRDSTLAFIRQHAATSTAGASADDEDARRAFAVPEVSGEWKGIDLDLLDPADQDELSILVEAAHPEYADALDDFGDVDIEGVNPHLHLALHTVTATQLWCDDPPQVWQTAKRLLSMGYDWHNVHHALAHTMAGQLYRSRSAQAPYDHAAHVRALDALPESWEADLRDDAAQPGQAPLSPPAERPRRK